jgi:diguanylate cyclase (GGDEF)-like protein/PAS domain S-box-containing protein
MSRERRGKTSDDALLLEAAIEGMSQGLVMYSADRRLVAFNDRARRIFGLARGQVHTGMALREVLTEVISKGNYSHNDVDAACAEFDTLISRGAPVNYLRRLANDHTMAVSHQPIAGGGWVSTFEDITERQRAEQRIEYLMRHDTLTSLANEASFLETLRGAVSARQPEELIAVLCLNLNQFNLIIDTFGRSVGDLLLQAVGERLSSCVRDGDTLARLTGDEFAIFRPHITEPDAAEALARKMLEACVRPLTINGHDLDLRVNIGISMLPVDAGDAEAALKCAHIALHSASNDGRCGICFFEDYMDTLLQARRALDLELRRALIEEQFRVYYQPIVDLKAGEISGFEALLRWDRSLHGIVAPDMFLSVAEDSGLLTSIGEWVLRRACADAAAWPLPAKVAVNLSATQFRNSDLYAIVVRSLTDANLPPSRLELEITETVLMRDSKPVVETLHGLRGLGVRIVMDDFGTGYSSLAYLRSFPFDKIKVDQSFVRDVADQADALAIVRAAIGLGRSLGMTTTAEGVETRQQMVSVRAAGCDEAQGYLISPPRPAERIGELIHRWNSERTTLFVADYGAIHIPQFASPGPIFSFGEIIEAANDIVMVTTADLDMPGPTIVYVNAAFTKLTGYSAYEALGRSPRMLQGPGTSQLAIRAIAVALRAGREVRQIVLNYGKSGEEYWLDLKIMPLRDSAGAITHFAAIQRDVTGDGSKSAPKTERGRDYRPCVRTDSTPSGECNQFSGGPV